MYRGGPNNHSWCCYDCTVKIIVAIIMVIVKIIISIIAVTIIIIVVAGIIVIIIVVVVPYSDESYSIRYLKFTSKLCC